MKKTIKKYLPEKVLTYYRILSSRRRLFQLVKNDKNRFLKYSSLQFTNDTTNNQIRYRLIYATHGIEKGLSHIDLRLGFGQEQLVYIRDLLNMYVDLGMDKKDDEYVDTLSVLNEYYRIHNEKNYNLSFFNEIFKEFLQEIVGIHSERSGMSILEYKSRSTDFKKLAANRYSVRNFSKKNVSNNLIHEAIKMSMKTPSACNRQMWKVRAIKEEGMINKVLQYQRGFSGYEAPPVLFLITISLESFQFPRERNQAFVDGGLFGMSFMYSLEYLELASCALNCEFTIEDEKSIREILELPDSEVMIMFIACGHFLEQYPVCKSPRISSNKVLNIIDSSGDMYE